MENKENGRPKIHLTVFSQAYYVDSVWGFGCPSGGIKRMGELCHKHNIPVTWLVSPKSARCEQEMFTEFHEKYGDEIAMFIRFGELHHTSERKAAQSWSVEKYRELIRKQKSEIEQYLPWANVKIAGQGIRTNNMLIALQQEGFIGMFGHCYCQIGVDSITDFGMPWGSFPTRPEDCHLPARNGEKGLIAFEWTMRDLNRSFHTVKPELWSTDTNDVERGGVCTDKDVEWWKSMFEQYERALPLNSEGIWFQFHQEAHEMTWGEICRPFNEQRVLFTFDMQDLFFEWLKKRESVEFLTASQAAELYLKNKPNGTIPMYVPYAWTPVPENLEFWDQVRAKKDYSGNISKHRFIPTEELYDYLGNINDGDPEIAMKSPPWTDSFFFFDDECQLVFDIGRTHPVTILNYLNFEPDPELLDMAEEGGGAPGFYIEEKVPEPQITFAPSNSFTLEINNPTNKFLPYGLFLWIQQYPDILDYIKNKSQNSNIPNNISIKISPDQGAFFRFNLNPGKNIIEL